MTAGAAAVVASIHEDLHITQLFFRANPASASGSRDANGGWPTTPTPNEPRNRALGTVREQNSANSPAASASRDWADSPGKTTSAKDRVKAATSVALSPNGKWLAVGESGYKPRILIFSLKDGSSETPVSLVAEHSFGVHALSFSPDSRFLASLGTVNDGFIHVWNIEGRTGAASLFASNKCTTFLYHMAWMGRSIVTVGLRFVKVWRPDDFDSRLPETSRMGTLTTPRQKESRLSDFGNSILSPKHCTLVGKNCLLGDLLEATFTSVVAITDTKAIICAETGEIALLDDSGKTQTLSLAVDSGVRITAARLDDSGTLHVLGNNTDTVSFLVSDLEKSPLTSGKTRRQSGSPTKISTPGLTTVAAATIGNAVVEIDSNRVIRLTATDAPCNESGATASRQLAAHEESVLGVQALQSSVYPDAAFLTFSGNGKVQFWDYDGVPVADGLKVSIEDSAEMYGLPNELKAVAMVSSGTCLVSGDRYGSLGLSDLNTRRSIFQIRGHSAEVLDLLAFERDGSQYVVSASRDRTVQLFACSNDRLELLQTMDEHAGAVTGLLLSADGEHLLSCSADRSIVIRECVFRDPEDTRTLAFAMVRAITLKSSPSSMCGTTQKDTILVSTIGDRCIGKYNFKNGQAGFSFKCSDNDGGEAVVMSKILYAPSLNGNPTIAGVSSSDKSVRLYSEYGSLIARDWGHTEGITDAAFVPMLSIDKDPPARPPQLVTVAADSTIFLWDNTISRPSKAEGSLDETDVQTPPTSALLRPPLRKVISHSEMSRFRRDRSTEDNESPSPTAPVKPPASPQKLRKKTSRSSLAQTPRLDTAFRPNFDPSRRRSVFQRSPSPPSPRNPAKKERGPSLGMSLRSKSSENILNPNKSTNGSASSFGSLTASTESMCRTLRAYRRKLASSSSSDKIAPDILRELEKELKLTARAVGEKSQEKSLDETVMTRLLDQASDKIVGRFSTLLDDRIKTRVEDEIRRSGEGSPPPGASTELKYIQEHAERSDATTGA